MDSGVFTGLLCLYGLLFIAGIVMTFFLIKWVYGVFFGKAKDAFTYVSRAALAEHGFQ